jgi:chromosome partitioning protein
MRVIVLANQKGGAGKTTLSSHLAVEASRMRVGPIALLDTDPQAGLAAWWNARQSPDPAFARMLPKGISATLADLEAKGCAMVFIDTPPALSDSIRQTLVHANLIVVPVQPSPNDLRAVGATVKLVRDARRQMVFVLNRANSRTRLTNDALMSLSQHGTIAPVIVQDRQDFRVAMIDGRTAQELDPSSKSAGEVGLLWSYLAEKLDHVDQAKA